MSESQQIRYRFADHSTRGTNEVVKRGPRNKYSKTGCNECRRRKMKCDEAKPGCQHCVRLNKTCIYELRVRQPKSSFSPGVAITTLADLAREHQQVPNGSGAIAAQTQAPSSIGSPMYQFKNNSLPADAIGQPPDGAAGNEATAPGVLKQHRVDISTQNSIDSTEERRIKGFNHPLLSSTAGTNKPATTASMSSSAQVRLLPPSTSIDDSTSSGNYSPVQYHTSITPFGEGSHTHSSVVDTQSHLSPSSTESSTSHFYKELFGDEDWASNANLIVNELSEIVNMKLSEVVGEDRSRSASTQPQEIYASTARHGMNSVANTVNSFYLKGIRKNLPSDCLDLKGDHVTYMEEFYRNFVSIILPLTAYSNRQEINPMRDILLTYAARSDCLLQAILATGAGWSLKKTSLREDEDAYCNYLSLCVESLGKLMEQTLLTNIEPILLTALLLTSDNAASTNQNWRPHLRGAKDLLIKYNLLAPANSTPPPVFVLCKFWYSSFEVLAGLGSPLGGTVETKEEIKALITIESAYELNVLQQLQLVRPDGFSLMHGVNVNVLNYLSDLLILIRAKGQRAGFSEVIPLLSNFQGQMSYAAVTSNVRLSPSSPFNNCTVDSRPCEESGIPPSMFGFVIIRKTKSRVCFSWYDLCHQAWVLALIITVFTRLLKVPRSTDCVQEAVKRLLSLMVFLEGDMAHKSNCVFILQWPMLVAGFSAIDDKDKYLVTTFFRLLAELGAGSAGFALAKIRKRWSQAEADLSATDEEIDLVTY